MTVTFTTDSYFHIGQTHLGQGKPCQDYAFSSVYENVGFAVVSDGCSKGRHTDIGSRVVALATAAAVKQNANISLSIFADSEELKNTIRRQQERTIKLTCETLDLELEDMLATCGYVCLSSNLGFIHLRGDGAIAVAQRDGSVKLTSYQWDKNAPLYIAYSEDNYADFINHHGGDPMTQALKIESWELTADKLLVKIKEEKVSVAEGIAGALYLFSQSEIENISFAAVFTDGVTQVGSVAGGGSDLMDWKEVVLQLMAFKSLAGDFAKRRIIRFLKDHQKIGKVPLDDIAYAVVQVGKEG